MKAIDLIHSMYAVGIKPQQHYGHIAALTETPVQDAMKIALRIGTELPAEVLYPVEGVMLYFPTVPWEEHSEDPFEAAVRREFPDLSAVEVEDEAWQRRTKAEKADKEKCEIEYRRR